MIDEEQHLWLQVHFQDINEDLHQMEVRCHKKIAYVIIQSVSNKSHSHSESQIDRIIQGGGDYAWGTHLQNLVIDETREIGGCTTKIPQKWAKLNSDLPDSLWTPLHHFPTRPASALLTLAHKASRNDNLQRVSSECLRCKYIVASIIDVITSLDPDNAISDDLSRICIYSGLSTIFEVITSCMRFKI